MTSLYRMLLYDVIFSRCMKCQHSLMSLFSRTAFQCFSISTYKLIYSQYHNAYLARDAEYTDLAQLGLCHHLKKKKNLDNDLKSFCTRVKKANTHRKTSIWRNTLVLVDRS